MSPAEAKAAKARMSAAATAMWRNRVRGSDMVSPWLNLGIYLAEEYH
jgi:hypothetical protein